MSALLAIGTLSSHRSLPLRLRKSSFYMYSLVPRLSAKVFHIRFIAPTDSFALHSIVQHTLAPGNSAPEVFPTASNGMRHCTSVDDSLANPAVKD